MRAREHAPRKRVRWRNLTGALCATFYFAAPLIAQERISPEQFLDMALGKTLTFHDLDGFGLVGVEEYITRDLSVWRDRSNICVYGQVTVQNDQLCFLYDNDEDGVPICWWTFAMEGRLLVLEATSLFQADRQQVVEITDDGLDCPTVPSV